MSRHSAPSEIDVQSLLQSAKALPQLPEGTRARVLARARMTAAAPLPMVSTPVARSGFAAHGAVAAAGAVVVGGIVGTVLAVDGGASRQEPRGAASSAALGNGATAPAAVAPGSTVRPPTPATAASVSSVPATRPLAPALTGMRAASNKPRREDVQESYAAELELMRNAHTAYAAHDFTSALVLVGEHARRFPSGLLSEEREALRVRCLLGAGRAAQARRAADSFAARFPRSVLLRRLQAEVGASSE